MIGEKICRSNSYLLSFRILVSAVAFLYPVSRLIKSIVEEKETRMRETLYILGVQPWALWWSWFLSSLLLFFVISVLVTRTLASNVLMHSSSGYLFLWIGFFSTSCIGFCFTVAALFSKAKLAAIIGPMALFATLLRTFVVWCIFLVLVVHCFLPAFCRTQLALSFSVTTAMKLQQQRDGHHFCPPLPLLLAQIL